MVPGVSFRFDERTGKVKPALGNVRTIVGISTYGSPRTYVWLTNDNGRRILTRALRMSCGIRTRTRWLLAAGTFLTTMLLGVAPASAVTIPSLSHLVKTPPCF